RRRVRAGATREGAPRLHARPPAWEFVASRSRVTPWEGFRGMLVCALRLFVGRAEPALQAAGATGAVAVPAAIRRQRRFAGARRRRDSRALRDKSGSAQAPAPS